MSTAQKRERFAKEHVQALCEVLQALPFADLAKALEVLERAYTERRQVFLAGNGGSAATASHMASDLAKGIAPPGGHGIRAICLSDNVPLLTAVANDIGYSEVFARPLAEYGQRGDILIVISASGNSPNILRAVETAQQMGITTIGFLGMGGGKASSMVDIAVVVPADDYGPVEDVHMVFDHLAMMYLKQLIAANSGRGVDK
jgi:D-sedoheptulose 7-phosphate isomerase